MAGLAVHSAEDAAKAAEVFCDMGVTTPIITLGDKGAYLHGHGLIAPFIAGAVVETTGAGDAFNGGGRCIIRGVHGFRGG